MSATNSLLNDRRSGMTPAVRGGMLRHDGDVMAIVGGNESRDSHGCPMESQTRAPLACGARVCGGKTSGQNVGRIDVGKVEIGCHLLGEQRAIVC